MEKIKAAELTTSQAMSAIPIYINVFNRLTTTKSLVEHCLMMRNAVPIIVDNNSTWGPLIDWYSQVQGDIEIVRLGRNEGHHAPWMVIEQQSSFFRKWGQDKYVVTDCDLDIGDVPCDVLEHLEIPLSWLSISVVKSGLTLKIDDLPEWQNGVVSWESQFWRRKFSQDDRFYEAPIDTTFAMYSCETPFLVAKTTSQICSRSTPPYTARHMPWYLDGENLDEENANYFRTSNPSNSWRPVPSRKCLSH